MEIISEAARHLPDELLKEAPEIPWKQIRGIGNILRHEYHKISEAIIWAVVEDHLPPLRTAVQRLLHFPISIGSPDLTYFVPEVAWMLKG